MSFVHLHTHSEYSLLDGQGRIKKLVAEAKRLGQPALALTDHGVMHGAVEFFRACKENEIKPIIGVESYQTVWGRPMGGRDPDFDRENYHLLLLAKNLTGYRNLLKIASHSQLNGYYYRPRIDHDFLQKHAEGIIATTGCMGAEVPQLLSQGKEKEAYDRLGWYVETFGKENFFIELQEHTIEELRPINKQLVPWADKFGIQLLATNDVHYVREEDASPHDVLLCVQTGALVNDEKRMRLSDQSYFLKSREQMEATFRPFIDLPASVYDNSLRIAEMCEVDLEDKNFHLPDIGIPAGFTYETYLRHLTDEGLQRLYGENAGNAKIQERKERELKIIHGMGFDVYFIIVWDLCQAMAQRNIWWNVRGSGAGSIVAYALNITLIDPLEHDLIFERFLNPGRISMPDFDLDIPDDSREEMIRYTIDKYGEDQVAQIVTFGRMKARAAVRDVGRVQGIDLDKVDRIAKLIPAIPGKPVTINEVMTEGHEFYNPDLVKLYETEPWVRELLDTSMQLEGVARHAGIHAAAVIVADQNLSEYVPLMRSSKGGVTKAITQFEFPICESIGLLKVDYLGLATLSIMREAARLIEERHGVKWTLHNIPDDQPEAFALLSSGEVTGVFQVESAGMRRILAELQPKNFQHVMAVVSLYRPGPLAYIPNFINRLHGREEVVYRHPALEPILKETLGILIYQEQIMRIATDLAGYTASEADFMRKAVSKKKKEDLLKHRNLMIKGAKTKGISEESVSQIFEDIEAFARYGFPKAHGADYALITVQTAYLKAKYPVEYMAALLLVERDKTEKVTNFINECRRMGIEVLPPDVNYSGLDFDIQERPADAPVLAHRDPTLGYNFPVPAGSAIRFGMAATKNVGEAPVQLILAARQEGGPFTSLEDFCDRVDLRAVGKRPLECLIKVGAFDRFGRRSQLLAVLDQMVDKSTQVHNDRASGQLSIFSLFGEVGAAQVTAIPLPNLEEAKGKEKLQWEKELLGVYANSHPLQQMNIDWRRVATCSCAELDERYHDKGVTLAGMIVNLRVINTKKGDQMAFVQIEDMQGQCEVVVFPRTYTEVKEKLIPDTIYLFKGKGQTRESQTSLLLESMQTYVDLPKAVEDAPSQYQKPLFNAVPTINGMMLHEQTDFYRGNGEESDDSADENSPQQDDTPTWSDDEDDEPVPATQQAETNPLPLVVAQTVINGKNGHAATEAEINARLAAGEPEAYEPLATRLAPPPAEKKPANGSAVLVQPVSKPSAPPQTGTNGKHGMEVPNIPPKTTQLDEPVATPATEQGSQTGAERQGDKEAQRATRSKGDSKGNPEQGTEEKVEMLPPAPTSQVAQGRQLYITFRRSGNLERDKFRLKDIYDRVRDPRGRDQFFIRLEFNGQSYQLAFPNDPCTISDRLTQELKKHFRVEILVQEN